LLNNLDSAVLFNLIDFLNDNQFYPKHFSFIQTADQTTPISDEVSIIFKDLPEEFKYIE
jgi:hypothetical protein